MGRSWVIEKSNPRVPNDNHRSETKDAYKTFRSTEPSVSSAEWFAGPSRRRSRTGVLYLCLENQFGFKARVDAIQVSIPKRRTNKN